MSTLTELTAIVRASLPDVTVWPDATLTTWIGQAVLHYSAQFSRVWTNEIAMVTGTQSYLLPAHLQSIESVEYPAGESPAQYVTAVPAVDVLMGAGGAVYALVGTDDSDTAVQNGRLLLAEEVTTGETAVLTYRAPHPVPTAGSDVLTIPDQHLGIVVQYCVWAGYRLQLSNEISNAYRNMEIVKQLTAAVESARDVLNELMDGAGETAVNSSLVVVWRDENAERIY